MHDVGPADGVRRGLRQAETAHLALGHQLAHGPDGLLDRGVGVHAVLVVEVDVVDAQPGQRAVAGLAHVLWPAVDGALGRVVRVAHDAELGGDHRLVASTRERPSDEQLVGVAARTCPRCRRTSRRDRAPGGWWRSTRRRPPGRRSRTSPCSRAPDADTVRPWVPSAIVSIGAGLLCRRWGRLGGAGPTGPGSRHPGTGRTGGSAAAGIGGDRVRARTKTAQRRSPAMTRSNSAQSSWVPPAAC